MSLLPHRPGTANRMQLLTSLAYLAVEAENSGDCRLASILRCAFRRGLTPDAPDQTLALTHLDAEASLNFLISFQGSAPVLQATVISLLEGGKAIPQASA